MYSIVSLTVSVVPQLSFPPYKFSAVHSLKTVWNWQHHLCLQILGWCIIIIGAFVGLLGTCYKNCRSQVSYLQLKFWKSYVDKEKERFDALALEYATKLAERNLQSFFENKAPDPFPFPNHKAWEEISAYYTFSRSEQYYSTLQRYVEKAENMNLPPEKRPVMDVEDGIEMN